MVKICPEAQVLFSIEAWCSADGKNMQMLPVRHCARDLCLLSQLILIRCHLMRKPAQRELVVYPRVHRQQAWELRTLPFQPTDLYAKGKFKTKPFLFQPAQHTPSYTYGCHSGGWGGTRDGDCTENVRTSYSSAFIHESWWPRCAYETTLKMAFYGGNLYTLEGQKWYLFLHSRF